MRIASNIDMLPFFVSWDMKLYELLERTKFFGWVIWKRGLLGLHIEVVFLLIEESAWEYFYLWIVSTNFIYLNLLL